MGGPGFEPVQQTFADNFAQRDELGAACAVYRHGEPVVDLWGGLRDRGLPWRQDTMVLVFSLTKGMTASIWSWGCWSVVETRA